MIALASAEARRPPEARARIRERFGASEFTEETLSLPADLPDQFTINIRQQCRLRRITLRRHSVRGADYRLRAFHDGRWVFTPEAGGRVSVAVGGGAIVGSTSVCDDQWRHVAVVLDNDGSPNVDELTLCVDGQLDVPGSASDWPIDTGAGDPAALDVTLGSYPPVATFYQGLLDDLRIYNCALTPAEIAAIAQ